MKSFRFAVFALLLTSLAHARPNVIAEWAFATADGRELGDHRLVRRRHRWRLGAGIGFLGMPPCTEGEYRCGGAAVSLHQRSWQYQGILGTPQRADLYKRPGLAMKEGIAVVSLQDMRIFELTNGSWAQVQYSGTDGYSPSGPDIEINSGADTPSRS